MAAGKGQLSGPQLKFCQGILEGKTQKDAYESAYANAGKSAEFNASRLIRNEKVAKYIEKMRLLADEANLLSVREKRAFLARVVRTSADDIETGDSLVQSRTISTSATGRSEKIEIPNKLQAIAQDNKMMGHDAPTQVEVTVNPLEALIKRIQER